MARTTAWGSVLTRLLGPATAFASWAALRFREYELSTVGSAIGTGCLLSTIPEAWSMATRDDEGQPRVIQ